MSVLLIDNYDSFTYNVLHLLRDSGCTQVEVVRNDALDLGALPSYRAVVASPGPSLPQDAGELLQAVEVCLDAKVPYLGICLGHQALGQVLGLELLPLEQVQHGIQDSCELVENNDLTHGVPSQFDIGRYHSWHVKMPPTSDTVRAFAKTSDGVVQAIAATQAPAYGLQFHPESIMTQSVGTMLIHNFLQAKASPYA